MKTKKAGVCAVVAVFLLSVFLLSGCAIPITKKELANMDYGTPLTLDYESFIKSYFEKVLVDPYSAKYRFSVPQKYVVRDSLLLGGKTYAGYIVFVDVNAKNRMGGYVGMQTYGFLFRNNQLIKVLDPIELANMRGL